MLPGIRCICPINRIQIRFIDEVKCPQKDPDIPQMNNCDKVWFKVKEKLVECPLARLAIDGSYPSYPVRTTKFGHTDYLKYFRSKTKQNSALVRLNWVKKNTANFFSWVFICQLVNHFDDKIYIGILPTHCIFKEHNFSGLITSNNDQFCQESNFKALTCWRKQVASSLLVNKPDNWKQDLAPTKIERIKYHKIFGQRKIDKTD